MKTIAYIAAAILLFFGVMFIWSSFGAEGATNLIIGIVTVAIGLVLVFWASRKPKTADSNNITVNIDMPGNVSMDTLKCKSCGGVLAPKDVTLVAGAPVVTCPYCKTTYQLTEEPKW